MTSKLEKRPPTGFDLADCLPLTINLGETPIIVDEDLLISSKDGRVCNLCRGCVEGLSYDGNGTFTGMDFRFNEDCGNVAKKGQSALIPKNNIPAGLVPQLERAQNNCLEVRLEVDAAGAVKRLKVLTKNASCCPKGDDDAHGNGDGKGQKKFF